MNHDEVERSMSFVDQSPMSVRRAFFYASHNKMTMLECIESREEKNLSILPLFYGKFLLSNLQKGQGLTVANTLRRILYSELTAISITSVRIQSNLESGPMGILKNEGQARLIPDASQKHLFDSERGFHEFSTLPFLKESLGEVIFNLKSILFKKSSRTSTNQHLAPQKAFLNLRSPTDEPGSRSGTRSAEAISYAYPRLPDTQSISPIKILRAKNLIVPSDLELVFPEQYIGTLTEYVDYNFSFECIIEQVYGHGTVQTGMDTSTKILIKGSNGMDLREGAELFPKELISDSDNILQDPKLFLMNSSVFPVKKVNYTIESDSFEKELVFFEVWTNGSLSPEEAVQNGIQKTLALFQRFQL